MTGQSKPMQIFRVKFNLCDTWRHWPLTGQRTEVSKNFSSLLAIFFNRSAVWPQTSKWFAGSYEIGVDGPNMFSDTMSLWSDPLATELTDSWQAWQPTDS